MSGDQLNMLGYFYSTIAQSIAAIIALFGLFATFRIQHSNIQKESALQSVRDYIKLKCFDGQERIPGYSYVDRDVSCWLDKDVPSHLREIIKKSNVHNNPRFDGFVDYYLFINSIETFTRHMIKRLVQYMAMLGAFLLFNIIALQTYEWPFWGNSFVIWGTIIFFGLMVCAVIVYTKDSLKGPNFIPINNTDTNRLDAQMFSIPEVEKIIKEVMTERNLSKRLVKAFKAWI